MVPKHKGCLLLVHNRVVSILNILVFLSKNLQEQQSQRTPEYDSLMKSMVTKMDPKLQRKLDALTEKWIRVKEETSNWHRL